MKQSGKQFFEQKLKIISFRKKILDVGGGRPWSKDMAKYKDWFKDSDYQTLDNDPNTHPDIVGDIHSMVAVDSSFDALICKAVLQHVENPQQAVNELWRVVKTGGLVLAYVPFVYPYHARAGVYQDYWRFTEDGIKLLFKNFKQIEIQAVDGYAATMLNFIPWRFARIIFKDLSRWLDKNVIRSSLKSTRSGFYVFAVK